LVIIKDNSARGNWLGASPQTPLWADGKGILSVYHMNKKLDSSLHIRLSQQEKLSWQEKATSAGMSLSTLIRQAMTKTRTWTVADRSLVKEQIRQISRIGNNLNQIAKWANTYKETAEAIEIIQALRAIEQTLQIMELSTKGKSPFPSAPVPEATSDVS
jgi:hypothetical protein